MREELAAFLGAVDLDDLLKARNTLGAVTDEDTKTIRDVIENWRPVQAVANLLFHPDLIPATQRTDALLRGLRDDQEPYYFLASTVGCQSLSADAIDEATREEILELLFEGLRAKERSIANRSSVSIASFLTKSDGGRVAKELLSADDTVAHNLSVWLLRSVQTEQPFSAATSLEAVQSTVDSAGLTDEERAAVMAKLDKVANLPINVMANGPMFLLGYIPNLVEFAPG